MPFLDFVQHHPVGTSVNATVDSYSSHGAYVKIGDVFGYVPLRLMSDPPPRSAREVMKVGDAVTLVVASFAPARRSIDCAVPNMASVVEPQDGEAVAAEAAGAVAPSAKKAAARKATAKKVAAAPAKKVAGSPAKKAAQPRAAKKAAQPSAKKAATASKAPATDVLEPTRQGTDRQGTDGQEGRRRNRSAPQGCTPYARTGARPCPPTRSSRRRRGRADVARGPRVRQLPDRRSSRTRRQKQPTAVTAAAPTGDAGSASDEPAAATQSGSEEGGRRVIRLATWNINSLKVRMPRVEQWLAEVEPDIVCLQETKVADDAFPALTFASMGYESAHHGQGQWNGVAVLSKVGLDDVVTNFAAGIDPDVDARIITATCAGIRVSSVYVPNGRSLDHEHYVYKLDWLGRLGSHVTSGSAADGAVVVAGDFNIAPDDRDVYDPAKFVGATHVSEPERARLRELADHGLIDVFRRHYDGGGVYSWWDYRAGDFHEGRGMRIDLILATEPVAERVEWCAIDRNARKGKLPSDHAPVLVDLRD